MKHPDWGIGIVDDHAPPLAMETPNAAGTPGQVVRHFLGDIIGALRWADDLEYEGGHLREILGGAIPVHARILVSRDVDAVRTTDLLRIVRNGKAHAEFATRDESHQATPGLPSLCQRPSHVDGARIEVAVQF